LEDLFPEEEYISAVKEAYPEIDFDFTATESTIEGVIDRVQALFSRLNLEHFEKWKPAAVIRDRIIGSPGSVPNSTLNLAEKIFETINSALANEVAPQHELESTIPKT